MSVKLTIDQDDVAINGDLTSYRALQEFWHRRSAAHGRLGLRRRSLLSNVVSFDNIALLLFDPSGHRLVLRAFERSHDYAAIEVDTEIMYAGTGLGRALKEQVPVFVPDMKQELAVYPDSPPELIKPRVHASFDFVPRTNSGLGFRQTRKT